MPEATELTAKQLAPGSVGLTTNFQWKSKAPTVTKDLLSQGRTLAKRVLFHSGNASHVAVQIPHDTLDWQAERAAQKSPCLLEPAQSEFTSYRLRTEQWFALMYGFMRFVGKSQDKDYDILPGFGQHGLHRFTVAQVASWRRSSTNPRMMPAGSRIESDFQTVWWCDMVQTYALPGFDCFRNRAQDFGGWIWSHASSKSKAPNDGEADAERVWENLLAF